MNSEGKVPVRVRVVVPEARRGERSMVGARRYDRAVGIWHRQEVGIGEEFDGGEAACQVVVAVAAALGLAVVFTVGVIMQVVSEAFRDRR